MVPLCFPTKMLVPFTVALDKHGEIINCAITDLTQHQITARLR